MSEQTAQMAWIERIETLVNILQDSSIGELELSENGVEIIIRREPAELIIVPEQQVQRTRTEVRTIPTNHAPVEDRSIAVVAPMTGAVYISPSPGMPPFVKIGDVIQPEQTVALIEAMKVFNEIPAGVAGRV